EGVVIAVDRPLVRFGRADETGRDRTPARPGSEELGPVVDPRRIAVAAEDVLVERLHEVAVSDVLGAVLGRGEERCRDLLLARARLELGHPGCDPRRITGAAEIGLVI